MSSTELAIRTDDQVAEIDTLADAYLLLAEKKERLKELAKEVADLENRIKDALGSNTVGTILGELAVTYRYTERLKEAKLRDTNPDLYRRYVKPVLVDQFDTQAFRVEHPNLYRQFQSRTLLVKGK